MGQTLPDISVKIAVEPPPPLRLKRPELSALLEAVVLKCLEKDRENRFLHARRARDGVARARASARAISIDRVCGVISAAGLPESVLPGAWRPTGKQGEHRLALDRLARDHGRKFGRDGVDVRNDGHERTQPAHAVRGRGGGGRSRRGCRGVRRPISGRKQRPRARLPCPPSRWRSRPRRRSSRRIPLATRLTSPCPRQLRAWPRWSPWRRGRPRRQVLHRRGHAPRKPSRRSRLPRARRPRRSLRRRLLAPRQICSTVESSG